MTPYHRLARESPDFEHWRLPVAALIGIGLFGFASVALAALMLVLLLAFGADPDAWLQLAGTNLALDHPSVLAFQLLSIAVLIPCVLVPVAILWRRHVGYLHSVQGRVRWRWLGRCLVLGFVVVSISLALAVVVSAVVDGEPVRFESLDGRAVASLAIVLLVVPFQATAEEYVFRGGLLQLIGSWTRWAVIPVVVTSLLFAAGHLYNLWGLVSVFCFGVIAAVMTIRTGGLEAAIGLHISNNIVLMVLDLVGVIDASGEGAGLLNEVVPTVLMCVVYWLLVERSARRRGLRRKRPPLPAPPAPTPQYVVVPPPPYVPAFGDEAEPGPVSAPMPAAAPRPPVPPNAPPYPGDPGVWGN